MTELLHRAQLKGPVKIATGNANDFAGVTAIASGATSVTVSTTVVKSNSIIIPSIQSLTDTASGTGRPIEVRTIVESGYFILAQSDGEALERDVNIHWVLFNTK